MRLTYGVDLPAHDPATVFAWHERPGALERLTPPWGEVEVVRRSGGIRDGGEVEMRIRRGPTTFHWHVRHRDYEENRQFRDEQVSGPLKSWLHVTLTVRNPVEGGLGLHGSGMFIVNPPWRLEEMLQEAMPLLIDLLGQDDGAKFTLEAEER